MLFQSTTVILKSIWDLKLYKYLIIFITSNLLGMRDPFRPLDPTILNNKISLAKSQLAKSQLAKTSPVDDIYYSDGTNKFGTNKFGTNKFGANKFGANKFKITGLIRHKNNYGGIIQHGKESYVVFKGSRIEDYFVDDIKDDFILISKEGTIQKLAMR